MGRQARPFAASRAPTVACGPAGRGRPKGQRRASRGLGLRAIGLGTSGRHLEEVRVGHEDAVLVAVEVAPRSDGGAAKVHRDVPGTPFLRGAARVRGARARAPYRLTGLLCTPRWC